jgi:hypothetical protein
MMKTQSSFSQRALWVSTILMVLVSAVQGISGNWITFFLIWSGGPAWGDAFTRAMGSLAAYHMFMGFALGALSILIILLAFYSKSSRWVKIISIIGLVMVALAASGGMLYVNSGLQDRVALGQMADALVGTVGIYLIQLFFMNRTPVFPWDRAKKS